MGRVLVDAPRSFDDRPALRARIRNAAVAKLDNAEGVGLDLGSRKASHIARLDIGNVRERPEAGSERVVTFSFEPLREGRGFESVGRAPARDDVAAGILAAFADGLDMVQQQRRLAEQPDSQLVEALGSTDARLREFAIEELGRRQSSVGVEPLCELLQQEEREELVLRAIGSLVSIGEPRAVEPIIRLSKRQDPAFVLQVVFAVGAIGGRTAEAYLVTMASGHPVEAVRKGAEDALAEMKRQRQQRRQRSKVRNHSTSP